MEHIVDRGSDIVFITETWLQSDKNSVTAEAKTYGYRLLHDKRENREKEEEEELVSLPNLRYKLSSFQ